MRQLARNLTIGSLLLGLQILGLGQSVALSIGSSSGTAGTTVSLPINLASSGAAQTAGLQWSFVFSSDITNVTVAAGPSATNAGKSVTCSTNSCLILGLNNTAMADGTVATATFQVASNPSTTSIPVQITGVVASTAAGISIPASGGTGTISLPGPPPIVSISLSPLNATLSASQSTQFTATVTGNSNTSVTWSMIPSLGSLSNGSYTAPSAINSAQSVTITATSVADPTKSASATVQLTPPGTVSVGVSPSTATLTASQTRQFTATVTGSANTSVTWSMTPSLGILLSNGSYTAPSAINSAQSVTITATSVADTTKSASATVQLTPAASSGVSISLSPLNTTLLASQNTQFTATVSGDANTSVTWSMTPSLGTLSNGSYTAPSVINGAQSVTITATSVADGTKSASATVQLTPAGSSGVSISLSPPNTTLTASQNTQFAATVTGNTNTAVTWSMNPSIGSLSSGLYTAPSAINSAQSVTITATSVADATKSASATVQLTPAVSSGDSIRLSPPNTTLTASQNTQFAATVTGNTNTAVTWSMNPSIGSLSSGLYSEPSAINSAQSVTITATSVADATKSASATVQLTPGGSTAPPLSINITSPTTQPTFVSSQSTIGLAGTAAANTTQVVWTTDQGFQGQATGTTNWAANGIALRSGSNRITVTARDSAGNQSSAAISVLYTVASIITSLPDAQLGQPYSFKLAVLGGTAPFTWSGASMPNGLTLSQNGIITGTPVAAGTFTLNVTVLDSLQVVTTAAITLRVDSGLVLESAASLQSGPVAPDSMVTVLGGQLANGTQSATVQPLPTTLGGCTVTVTDATGVVLAAGIYYVSPNQINFKVPTNAAAGSATVAMTCGAQNQTFGTLTIAAVSPGLYFLNSDKLAAADLTRVSGNVTTYAEIAQLDSTTNQFVAVPIDLGSDTDQVYLTLYGTGIRNRPSLDAVQVLVANVSVPVDFAGASTTSDGLDLVHVLLPTQLRGAGTANVVVTVSGISSNSVNVVIK